MRSEIQCLEGITNRTTQQEQELQTKKAELARLEAEKNQSSNNNKPTSYLPWILGGLGALVLIVIIAYFLTKKTKRIKK